jgi:hypothetical protein
LWHRLSRDDFDRTSELMGGDSASSTWSVCKQYELKTLPHASRESPDAYLVVPKHRYEPAHFDKWRIYEPLEDTPDLFLKFARLHRADDENEAMLTWVRSYGTLGHGKPLWVPGAPQDAKGFREAVSKAAGVLALYEAVLNGDGDAVRSAILYEYPYVGVEWGLYNELPEKQFQKARAWWTTRISDSVDEIYGGSYLNYALETAAYEVQHMVGALCSPALTVAEDALDISGVRASWNFKSLLGAMYLQMYWLMTAGSDLTRCEHCGLLISLARPRPEGRKRRRDKRFCNDACRQAHHRNKKRS